MTRGSVDQNFLFTLGELYRLLRVYADKEASRFGIPARNGRCWPRSSAARA